MDTSSIASLATQMQTTQLQSNVGIAMLKKSMDIQASQAMQLLAAIPTPPNPTATQGNNINTFA
jgi:Putative motility protein